MTQKTFSINSLGGETKETLAIYKTQDEYSLKSGLKITRLDGEELIAVLSPEAKPGCSVKELIAVHKAVKKLGYNTEEIHVRPTTFKRCEVLFKNGQRLGTYDFTAKNFID